MKLMLMYTVNQAVLIFNPEAANGLDLSIPIRMTRPKSLRITSVKKAPRFHSNWQRLPNVEQVFGDRLQSQNDTLNDLIAEENFHKENLKNVTIGHSGFLHAVGKWFKILGIGTAVIIPAIAALTGGLYLCTNF